MKIIIFKLLTIIMAFGELSISAATSAEPGEIATNKIIGTTSDMAKHMTTYVFRLQPNQDLKKELKNFVESHSLRAGVMLTVVGSLSAINLRMAGGKECLNMSGDFEILSLTGTLSTDGNHLHLTVSDHTGKTLGGHLMDGCIVRTTAEIAILSIEDLSFKREKDDKTGYDELVIKYG